MFSWMKVLQDEKDLTKKNQIGSLVEVYMGNAEKVKAKIDARKKAGKSPPRVSRSDNFDYTAAAKGKKSQIIPPSQSQPSATGMSNIWRDGKIPNTSASPADQALFKQALGPPPVAPTAAPAASTPSTAATSATKEKPNEYEEQIKSEMMDESPGVYWKDIAGLEMAKQTLQEAVILPNLRCVM